MRWTAALLFLGLNLWASHSFGLQPEKPAPGLADWLPARTLLCVEAANAADLAEWLAGRLTQPPVAARLDLGGATSAWLRQLREQAMPPGDQELAKSSAALFAVLEAGPASSQWVVLLRAEAGSGLLRQTERALTTGTWKELKTIQGVKTYGHALGLQGSADGDAEPKARTLVALADGVLMYGTAEAVGEVLLRRAGQAMGGSLAALPAYKTHRGNHTNLVGATVYCETGKLLDGLGGAGLADLVKPDAVGVALGTLFIDEGLIAAAGTLNLPDDQRAILSEAIPATTLSPALLGFLPKESQALLASSVDGPEQLTQAAKAAEQLAKKLGWPGTELLSHLKRAQGKAGFDVVKEFSSRLRQLAMAQTNSTMPDGTLIVLEARSTEGADWLRTTGLPKLIQGLTEAAEPPRWEPDVDPAVAVLSAGGFKLYAAQHGATLVLAFNAAATLNAWQDGKTGAGLAQEPVLLRLCREPSKAPGMIVALRPLAFEGIKVKPAESKDAGAGGPPKPDAGTGAAAARLEPPKFDEPAPPADTRANAESYRRLFAATDWLALGLRHGGTAIEFQVSAQPLARWIETAEVAWLGTASQLAASTPGGLPGQPAIPMGLKPKKVAVGIVHPPGEKPPGEKPAGEKPPE